MAIFRTNTTVPLGGTVANLMAGSKFEFLSRPSAVTVWASQDVAGDDVQLDVTLGNVVVAEDVFPNLATDGAGGATIGLIKRADDLIGTGVGDAGDRIQIRARNTDTGFARNVNVMVEIAELA